jgi:hypothetical protein
MEKVDGMQAMEKVDGVYGLQVIKRSFLRHLVYNQGGVRPTNFHSGMVQDLPCL